MPSLFAGGRETAWVSWVAVVENEPHQHGHRRGILLNMWTSFALALLVSQNSPALPSRAAQTSALSAYEWFHAHPELSGQEQHTARYLADRLRQLGLTVTEGVGGHGIVGVLQNGAGPVVLYRADMDGLPVLERTGLPYASKNQGVMHACGHDVHMATAIGVLESLVAQRDAWAGSIVFVGQPAEEIGKGARAMLGDQKFKAILKTVGKPDVALALHDGSIAAGDVSLVEGFHHANVDSVDITLFGKGGHGARPHETVDPVVMGAELVLALQTIVSRRIPPDARAVVTVGRFSAGTKHNIIAPEATLLLTVRSYTDETRRSLLAEIKHITASVAQSHHAPRPPSVVIESDYTPAAYNDPQWTNTLRARFKQEFGSSHVFQQQPSMGGEDFGMYGKTLKIPAVMWTVGALPRNLAKKPVSSRPGLHSDAWAPDPKPTLKAAIQSMTAAILEVLGSTRSG